MAKCKVYKNNWAGHDTYFVLRYTSDDMAHGTVFTKVHGSWITRKGCFSRRSLKDQEYFPVVGYVDLEEAMVNALLEVING